VIPETFTSSLWHATAPEAPPLPPLDWPARADVVIVGAGILGLTLAMTLARSGVDTLVLERDEIGFGASGRNGGLVVPAFPRLGPSDVIKKLGAPGERLVAAIAGSAAKVFGLIKTHALSCEAVQSGWIMPAHAQNRMAGFEARARDWERFGHTVEVLDKPACDAATGSGWWHGAMLDREGGHLNPLAYTRGLAQATLGAGARIATGIDVTAINGTSVETSKGLVHAGRIVLATNALPSTPLPGFSASVVPLHIWQMATKPYPPELVRTVVQGSMSLSDTRNDLFAVRWTRDNRLVIGGMAVLLQGAGARLAKRNAKRIAEAFPQLGPVEIDQVWHGRASLTPDLLPRLYETGPVIALTACNGRGIGMNTVLGEALAHYLTSGDASQVPLPFDQDMRPVPKPTLAAFAPRALLPLGRLKDALDRRT
jgi:glycine/D-amino acid oxidase-like deaminating enzyme